ncbi:hypothetical protein EON66_05070 [archaeon]|nr:MAG: hypothetical protein EON66_05070 [archaeon]
MWPFERSAACARAATFRALPTCRLELRLLLNMDADAAIADAAAKDKLERMQALDVYLKLLTITSAELKVRHARACARLARRPRSAQPRSTFGYHVTHACSHTCRLDLPRKANHVTWRTRL